MTIWLLPALAVAALAAVSGCAEHEITFGHVGPTLTPADLGASNVSAPPTGCVVLEKQRSEGRFPAAVAVARLEPPEASSEPAAAWRVASLKPEQATWWNSLFRAVPQVREVIVLDPRGIVAPDARLPAIADAALRRQARLCYIYGPAAAEPDHAALTGVLVDTSSKEIVAVIQADAGPEDAGVPPLDRPPGDLRYRDPDHLAVRKLQAELRRCVLDLIARDTPQQEQDPNPWQGAASRPATEIIVIPAGPICPPSRYR